MQKLLDSYQAPEIAEETKEAMRELLRNCGISDQDIQNMEIM